tara:strand:- start:2485 stop:3417 length:933 start_codon:yes stop_codon:yes gene_type:complete
MSQPTKRFPDFLIIGAGKSGTTSIDKYIGTHPHIYMSERKDPGFFASEPYNLSDDMYPESVAYYQRFITNESEYLRLFSLAKPDQLTGETTTMYLYSEGSPDRIRSYIPDTKLIAVLRQPAERIFSRYLHLARENQLPTDSFEDIFDQNSKWWIRPDLINEGFYFKHLKRFYDIFPEEHIQVILYDEMKENQETMFRNLFQFLGVEEDFVPETDISYNQSGFIKNKWVNKVVGYNNPFVRILRKTSPGLLNTLKSNKAVLKGLNSIRSKNLHRPGLSVDLKKKITEEIYMKDIVQLEKLIGRDLSKWRII